MRNRPATFGFFRLLAALTLLIFPLFARTHTEPVTVLADLESDSTPTPALFTDDVENELGFTTSSRAPASAGAEGQMPDSSRFPANVSDGFELKVLYKKMASLFWVVKRQDHFDLLYANSSGSKGSISLSAEIFARLQGLVLSFKPTTLNVSKCEKSNIRLNSVVGGKPARTVVSCADAKGPEADRLRSLSQSLASLVQ